VRRMIEYDYTLERDYLDEKRTFVPADIPKSLESLVYIEGPNSSGKSTLLNILALGFHGLKKERLNPALRDKMSDLVNSDHQKLKFEFRIKNRDGDTVLVSSKSSFDNREIIVKEYVKGKETILTPDLLHRKYNLIYDIPDNPTDRLNQLVIEIRETQRAYYNRLGSLRNHVRSAINEIKGGRDPKRIAVLGESIRRTKAEVEAAVADQRVEEESLDLIERYTFSQLYVSTVDGRDSASCELEAMEKMEKKTKNQIRKVSNEYQSQYRTVRTLVDDMIEKKKEISSQLARTLLKDDKHHLKVWDRIDLQASYDDFEVSELLDTETIALQRILHEMSKESSNTKELAEAKVLSDLIGFLDHYRNSDVVLPGVGQTVDGFLSILEEHYNRFKATKVKSDNLTGLMNELTALRGSIRYANTELAKLKELKAVNTENGQVDLADEQDAHKKELLETKVKSLSEIAQSYMIEMRKKGVREDAIAAGLDELAVNVAIKPYRVYSNQQLKELVNSLRMKVIAGANSLKDKINALTIHTSELKRLESLEQHRYTERLPDLESILKRIQRLENQMGVEYDNNISSIINKKAGSSEPEKAYQVEVAKYLGRKVGFIRHIHDEYTVSKIDLVAGNIVTHSGKRIRLTDMGTGQGQSAYLSGLLNTEDGRPIIALFDEIAMMDEKSMEPIYKKFRDLHKKGRLLVGIVVQKGESVRIISKA